MNKQICACGPDMCNCGATEKRLARRAAREVAPPVPEPAPPDDDLSRCAVCGWPLAESIEKGCVRGNCSMRPFPSRAYSLERALLEYEGHLKREHFAAAPAPPAGERRYTQAELTEACALAAERGAQNEREGRLPAPAGAGQELVRRLRTKATGACQKFESAGTHYLQRVVCKSCGCDDEQHLYREAADALAAGETAREAALRERLAALEQRWTQEAGKSLDWNTALQCRDELAALLKETK